MKDVNRIRETRANGLHAGGRVAGFERTRQGATGIVHRTLGAVVAALVVAAAAPAFADTTGELHATQALAGAFTNATNAFVCDGVTADVTSNNQTQIYAGFGISVPPAAIITGIQVRVRANDGTRNNRKFQVSLSWNGGSDFTAVQQTRNIRRNAPLRDFVVGGSAYTWNRTWTAAELSDANFRLRLLGRMPGGTDPIHLDCVPITVYYRLPGEPSLNLAKTDGPDPIEPLQNLTYTITYSNTGESTATNVIVSDVVPTGTTFVSASPPAASAPAVGGTGTVTWNVGSVPPGGGGAVTLVVKANAGLVTGDDIVNNIYSVASDQNQPSPGNPVTTSVVNPVVLSLAKADSPDPVQPGANLTYVLTYTNAGNAPATGVIVSEAYDANVTFLSSVPAPDPGFDDQWTIGTISPGASGTITITAQAVLGLADGVLLTNQADLSDDASNFAEAAAVTTVQNVASLSISKTDGPDPVESGSGLTYTITYENSGTTTLTGVTVLEVYDANVSFVGATPAPDSGTDDTWTIGTLDPGEGGSITITTTVAAGLPSGTLLHNQVFISDDAAHSAAASASTLVVQPPCGDSIVQPGEDCDEGGANGTSASCCSATCTFRAALEPCDDDGNDCTDDVCSGSSGTCQHEDNTAPCDDGVFCNGADTCSGGACSVHAGDPCPGPNGDENCAESCDEGAQSCTGIDPPGTPCRPSAGECDAAETCDGANPTCPADTFQPSGTSCGTDLVTDCTDADTCDGAGACLANDAPAGATCGSPDDTDCTAPDSCDGAGTCLANHASAGAACADDGEVCTIDTCDGGGVCDHQPGNAGTVCRPASGACDIAEECDGAGATCPPDGFQPSGTSCGSGADTDCTNPDTCDGNNQCLPNHEPAGTTCGDGDACTADDACDGAGVCLPGTEPTVCPPCELCDGISGCVAVSQMACESAVPDKSVLVVADRSANHLDRIVYRQKILPATSKADFGNPVSGAGYQLCIYDDKQAPGSPDTLVYAIDIPGGATWRETNAGFVNRSPATDPALKTVVRAGLAGRGRIAIRAKGEAVGLVPHGGGVFFDQSNEVSVILLVKGGGKCFRSNFPAPAKSNQANGFRDKD